MSMTVPDMPKANIGEDGTMDTQSSIDFQKAWQEWCFQVTAITNALKSEHEGNMAVARNMKA